MKGHWKSARMDRGTPSVWMGSGARRPTWPAGKWDWVHRVSPPSLYITAGITQNREPSHFSLYSSTDLFNIQFTLIIVCMLTQVLIFFLSFLRIIAAIVADTAFGTGHGWAEYTKFLCTGKETSLSQCSYSLSGSCLSYDPYTGEVAVAQLICSGDLAPGK